MKEGALIEVKWIDAWSTHGTYYKKDNDYTPMQVSDIGYFMEENDDTLVFARQKSEGEDGGRHLMIIPWEYIKDIEELI